ncbi:hypothetical protein BT96DRAFT_932616 [Gymnopus androsaceus JB14]|uniref:Uncharacterized protein n=1 Tax=Gymnopus androsaceus JB14 TaxID=1447944 RepID=A0A6A4IF81_9AGAR|nr:hypothetical protein BT96DRAFT_932616 [Gymnopus androsaceus JB14]
MRLSFRYKPALIDLIEHTKLLQEECKKLTSLNLALVLVHDVLFSGGIQAGDGPIKQAVLCHKTRLSGELQKLKIKHGVKSNKDLAQTGDSRTAQIPRYVCINTVLWSFEDAIQHFVSKGFTLKDLFPALKKEFSKDKHIPALLLFQPQVSLQDEEAYQMGKVILQDKASCFPAPASADSAVIDATSAPVVCQPETRQVTRKHL